VNHNAGQAPHAAGIEAKFGVGSLFIWDIASMPAACGAWPALWFTGNNWPIEGEIDIIEGVNLFCQNGVSFHSGGGQCTMADWNQGAGNSIFMSPGGNQQNCDAYATNDLGCGLRDTNKRSFGPCFNADGGGVMALRLDGGGVYIWHWARGSVPGDVQSGSPNPSSWGTPVALLSPDGCNIGERFQNLMMVVNTNLGGPWASDSWSSDTSYASENGNCASTTGVGSISDYIQNHGDGFNNAKWIFNRIQIYSAS